MTATTRRLDRFDRETQIAVCAVGEGMHLARSLEGRAPASTKSDTSPVTVADFAVQAVVAQRLRGCVS
jgi:3'-phosphoadenosine 5'-phosphosulfate (PAPS) 3'-phosphatase